MTDQVVREDNGTRWPRRGSDLSGVIALSDERPAAKGDVQNGNERAEDGAARTSPGRTARRRSDRDVRKLEPQIGRALRTVYDETVGEEIPPEMLELLGKLS